MGGCSERLSANDRIYNEDSLGGENIQRTWNHGTVQPVQKIIGPKDSTTLRIDSKTHPQENRHCTIALVPSLGPNTALKRRFQNDTNGGVYIFTSAKLTNTLGP